MGDDEQHVPAPPVAAEKGHELRAQGHTGRRGVGEDPPQRDRPQEHGSRREDPDPRHGEAAGAGGWEGGRAPTR